jgi:hypothetical protein
LGGDQTEVEGRLQPAADEDRAADRAGERAVYLCFGGDGGGILATGLGGTSMAPGGPALDGAAGASER